MMLARGGAQGLQAGWPAIHLASKMTAPQTADKMSAVHAGETPATRRLDVAPRTPRHKRPAALWNFRFGGLYIEWRNVTMARLYLTTT